MRYHCCSRACGGDQGCFLNGTCKQGCAHGFYGNRCFFACSSRCGGNGTCDVSGRCIDGCNNGYTGPQCTARCSPYCDKDKSCMVNGACNFGCVPGFYHPTCTLKCSETCRSYSCNGKSGVCTHGCKDGFWGSECQFMCSPSCGRNGLCDVISGSCNDGCRTGFWGSECQNNCSAIYGGNQTCDLYSGRCIDGCKTSYWGSQCQHNCSATCGGSRSCDIISGKCNDGCKTGFWGFHCKSDCNDNCGGSGRCDFNGGQCIEGCMPGFWGSQCQNNCSVTCDGDRRCELITGDCIEGCMSGYWGPHCQEPCLTHYGENRSSEINIGNCSYGCNTNFYGSISLKDNYMINCDRDGVCDNGGSCFYGCKTGYFGSHCTERGLQSVDGDWTCHCAEGNCSDENNPCPTEQCVKGWFAYSCLYQDAGAFAEMTHPALNDNSDSTCYETPDNNVTANWKEEHVVSWIRLTFDIYRAGGWGQGQGLGNLSETRDTESKLTERVGRNMNKISSTFVKVNNSVVSIPALSNGDISNVSCTRFDNNRKRVLYLSFNRVVVIDEVTLFTSRFMRSSVIDGDMRFRLLTNRKVHQIHIISQTLSVLEIHFMTGQVDACEVELIGDCGLFSYGQYCQGICRFTCYRNRCTYDGRCFDCVLGRSGTHCESSEIPSVSIRPDTSDNNESAEENRKEITKNVQGVNSVFNILITLVPFAASVALLSCLLHITDIDVGPQDDVYSHRTGPPDDLYSHRTGPPDDLYSHWRGRPDDLYSHWTRPLDDLYVSL
ncbi:hypothetical protein Btru_075957 [Bulinus truncatus]|nr:hypothetical protein Btru_075957 [Bulinus truncatus]